ncbi:hypothetical protein KFO32_03220 [Pantoea ananatis]|uniref:hypothetical protein n=1 Tax=Pantoea ananas TaxID=553 RepID=UPI001FF165FF|nr:hypothetical protein [Pantoea ananatis]MCK0552085.1 hypothetical protein [Pantoea ananatis]
MLKKLKKTLTLSKSYSKKIDTFDIAKLEKVKDDMIDEMEEPVGWHTMGLPLVASCFLALFSFVIPQTSLWQGIYTLMGWPKYALMIGIMVSAFFYAFLVVLSLLFISKGSYVFLRYHLFVLAITTLFSLLFVCYCFFSWLTESGVHALLFGLSFPGLFAACLSWMCLDTDMFYRMIAYCLHNRAWRKQIKRQRKNNAS